jgi:hypothetical protein
VYAGFGDDDGPITVQELPAILGVGRCSVNGRAVVSHATASGTSGY